MFELDVKIEGLENLIREFGEDDKRLKKVHRNTIKELAKRVKTRTAQEMVQVYTLPSKRIKSSIALKWPTYTQPAIVTFSGKPPGLQHYKPKETRGRMKLALSGAKKGGGITGTRTKKAGKQQGLTVEVHKGTRRLVEGAWLDMYNNAIGVFKRIPGTESSRYPGKEKIDRLHGPSIMGMFNAIDGMATVRKVIWEDADKIFNREWDRVMRK